MAIVFNEQIKILTDLQKIDSEIYQLKKELATHPDFQKRLESGFEQKKTSLKTVEERVRNLQLKQKEKEGDLQSKEEKIKKLQTQLYQLKSNKEYAVMELEIKGLKADKSLLEEEILKLLDAVDEVRASCTKEKELLGSEEKKVKGEIETLQKRSKAIQAEIQALEEKRKAFLPAVEPKLMAQYEKVLIKREGLALAPVRNNSCGGCHIELPPQVVNEIQLQEKMIICESCARILYWIP